MINLTPIIEALIALIAALITFKVIPWIKAKTSNEKQQFLSATIKTLVFAAEQLYGSGMGKEKLEYVVARLEDKGMNIDIDAIEAAIKEHTAALHAGKE